MSQEFNAYYLFISPCRVSMAEIKMVLIELWLVLDYMTAGHGKPSALDEI
jgi:hypothetical protein